MNKLSKLQIIVGCLVLFVLLKGIHLESPGITRGHYSFQLGSGPESGILGTLEIILALLGVAYLSLKQEGKNFFEFLSSLTVSENDLYIGGVCGGLARHSAIPAWVWRMTFAVLFFGYGTGLMAYVALWIFVPLPTNQQSREEGAAS